MVFTEMEKLREKGNFDVCSKFLKLDLQLSNKDFRRKKNILKTFHFSKNICFA